ncbi:MAG TPA: ATP-binding protein [Spirochaetota bacterium]|nr:ATP-binding protein [Spirochaetota bacterium]
MAFITGPRQSGKTTTSRMFSKNAAYLNWDNDSHRSIILKGTKSIARFAGLDKLTKKKITVIFDEIHKFLKWKNFVKGFFDIYEKQVNIIVTGSSSLSTFKKGGDSLAGRYFLYRHYPLSVREVLNYNLFETEVLKPHKRAGNVLQQMYNFGGYPEVFLKKNRRFTTRWQNMWREQIFRDDLRDLTNIKELDLLESLALIIADNTGNMCNYATLAAGIHTSVDTVKRWINTLSALYYCFLIRPWYRNIRKSLRKQPKVFLWDWSLVKEPGKRLENLTACHLLKAVHFWQDIGLGNYGLYYLRDKTGRETDFLIVKDGQPWFQIEVKTSDNQGLSKNLFYFHEQLKLKHSFQAIYSLPNVNVSCFDVTGPFKVPLSTLLSQLA